MTVGKLREMLAGFRDDAPVCVNAKKLSGDDYWIEFVGIGRVSKPYDVVEILTDVLLEVPRG